MLDTKASRSRPVRPAAAARTAAGRASAARSRRRASSSKARPAGVSATERRERSNSITPSVAFKGLHRLRQRRLGHRQALRGTAEVQFLGHGDELVQRSQFDH